MRRPLQEIVDLHHVILHDPVEPRLRLIALGRELTGAQQLSRRGRHHRARDHSGYRLHFLAETRILAVAESGERAREHGILELLELCERDADFGQRLLRVGGCAVTRRGAQRGLQRRELTRDVIDRVHDAVHARREILHRQRRRVLRGLLRRRHVGARIERNVHGLRVALPFHHERDGVRAGKREDPAGSAESTAAAPALRRCFVRRRRATLRAESRESGIRSSSRGRSPCSNRCRRRIDARPASTSAPPTAGAPTAITSAAGVGRRIVLEVPRDAVDAGLVEHAREPADRASVLVGDRDVHRAGRLRP